MYRYFGFGTALRRGTLTAVLLTSLGLLSACDSSEERAEKHFETAMALLAEGDEKRAIVEFRNVFKLNGTHREARVEYAALQRNRGNVREAIGQYRRLMEQYPDDPNGNRTLAELNAELGNWEATGRYVATGAKIDPNDTTIQALQIVLDYRTAVENRDTKAANLAAEAATEKRIEMPDYQILWQVTVDNHIRNSEFGAALTALDQAIEILPEDHDLYMVRLSVLGALEDDIAIESQLKDMIVRFPEDDTSRTTLVQWYVSQGQLDEAETFLRDAIDPASDDPESRMTLLQFLTELRGKDFALTEVEKMIADGSTAPIFASLKSGLEFELGEYEIAIAEMEELVVGLEPSDESRTIKFSLAQMLLQTGNVVGARAMVEEILSEDGSQADALKLKASWLIESDDSGEAIVALRTALEQSPRDPEIMTLMAQAHERDGNQELVGEMLSLAVEAANRAPTESIRYSQYLQRDEKFTAAESILVESLRLSPSHLEILVELGDVYLGMSDWPRAEQVIETMLRMDSQEATDLANELNARFLQAQDKTTEAVAFLEGLAVDGNSSFEASVAIVRAHLGAGDSESARNYVDTLLADDPNNAGVQFMDAAVNAATGKVTEAESTYRDLLEKDDATVQVWIALYRLMVSQGETDRAARTIAEAQLALPDDGTLKWIKAGLLENAGDIDGAIGIYEDLYALDSNNLIVANNLASLMTGTTTDSDAIENAFKIAKRLRQSPVPPYQDTYGWIAFLRGDHAAALSSLEPAAAALSSDPLVQYHLAAVYVALEQNADAIVQFRKVAELTGPADTRTFVETSRSEIARLLKEQEDANKN